MRLNIPAYFAPEEAEAFEDYLLTKREDYFVLETAGGEVMACGGINWLDDSSEARLSWDMVHPEAHGKGYGTMLVNHRLGIVKTKTGIKRIVVRTSQLAFGFYTRCGFVLKEIVHHYWAPGYHLYFMEYEG